MDPLPFPTPPTAAAVDPPQSHPLPPLPTSKLRLMCSYGGHIVPRPQTKPLCYAGGETRIVAVDRRTSASTISSLTHHLSRTLLGNRPFTLKYQLPNEDLDSLISITTDEDLQNMLEEHDRIASSPTPARIRLFLFPTRPESVGSLLLDPKSESWFSDALKSSMIINRGLSDGSGMVNGIMGLDCLEGTGGGESGSVPESMVLETCSSFGSMSSSISTSNLPPIGVNSEEKLKVAASGSIESDNSAASTVPCQKSGVYQDQVLPTVANTPESESIIYNPSTIQMQKTVQAPGYQMPHILDQNHQPVQYIHPGPPHYIQYQTGQLPLSSYYPMYMPYQQTHQPYPVYVMPVGPTTQSLTHPPLHTHISNSHATHQDVMVSHPTHEPETYRTVTPQTTHQSQQRFTAALEMRDPSQPVDPSSTANPSFENEYDNDLVYAQIYKSQPSVPVFPPPKYETVKKSAAVQLSDSASPQ